MSRLFNFSEASTIALHSMGLIAQSKEALNAFQIAEMTGFSRHHISKVLQQLVKYNMLSSIRGPKGGFLLNRKAEDINLLEVYSVIEGVPQSHQCSIKCENCPFSQCIFGGLTEKFTKEFRQYLEQKKISDLKTNK